MASNLSLCSSPTYNSCGHGIDSLKYMQYLVDKNDFVFIQEHWLHSKQISFFDSNWSYVKAYTISRVSSNELLSGRPYGGYAIMLKRNIEAQVIPVCVDSSCICAVKAVFTKHNCALS